MNGIFNEATEVYLARLAPRGLPPIFEEMHGEASMRNFPIVGPEVGRFFLQLARLRQPGRILELGSGFGYSALWFALGSPQGTEIHCTEYDSKNVQQGQQFAEKAGISKHLTWHLGEALKTAKALGGHWDIIFCDIDKEDYPDAYRFARERMRQGDLLIFDNMLWHGNVALPQEDHDKQTAAVIETTEMAYADKEMNVSLIPLRDGLLFAMRK